MARLKQILIALLTALRRLFEDSADGSSPSAVAGTFYPDGGSVKNGKTPIRITADWTVPHSGPSGSVNPANYSLVSSFDIDWLNTPGFQVMLDNLAASPGAFKTVRVMKALNSGTAELGNSVATDLPPAGDSVWAYNAPPPDPTDPAAFSATISALTELTKRGLIPFVVLGFFPDGVYSNTIGGLPGKNPLNSANASQNSPFGPNTVYLANNPGDWTTIRQNWNKLIQAFFQKLNATFGSAIQQWWFEVWNEPDNDTFWNPDDADSPINTPLYYYCQLYQETVSAIASVNLGFPVRVGGPAIMASQSVFSDQTDLQVALPIFLDYVYSNGLQCDFISLHEKGDWLEYKLPDLAQVINTIESAVNQFTTLPKYQGYFDKKPIVNDEADMRVGAVIPFYPRMNSQFPAWLTALMIAHDSLTSEYASNGGAQFVCGSDNAHLELVGWQPNPAPGPSQPGVVPSGGSSGMYGFGQQRSIMTAASPWSAGTEAASFPPQDLVKLPVYNFYELLRLLGNQHGVFISGQQNFYPTSPTSDLFSAITVGAPAGQLTHICWVFCVYPTANNGDPKPPVPPPQPWSFPLEVIDLPASWTSVNWVQFQVGPPQTPDSFIVAQKNQQEKVPPAPTTQMKGDYLYDMPTPPLAVNLSSPSFNATNVRMAQELGVVQFMQNFPISNGAWKSPASVDLEPYSSTVFWITQYDRTVVPATPVAAYYTSPGVNGTQTNLPVAVRLTNGNVMIRWQYPVTDASDPRYYTFFHFEVYRDSKDGIPITPSPVPTKDGIVATSFVLRAAMWIDTAPAAGSTYYIRAISASGTPGGFLASATV